MIIVPLAEAKNNLSKLVDDAAAGQVITIAKHGRALARLVPDRKTLRSANRNDERQTGACAKTLTRHCQTTCSMLLKALKNEASARHAHFALDTQ